MRSLNLLSVLCFYSWFHQNDAKFNYPIIKPLKIVRIFSTDGNQLFYHLHSNKFVLHSSEETRNVFILEKKQKSERNGSEIEDYNVFYYNTGELIEQSRAVECQIDKQLGLLQLVCKNDVIYCAIQCMNAQNMNGTAMNRDLEFEGEPGVFYTDSSGLYEKKNGHVQANRKRLFLFQVSLMARRKFLKGEFKLKNVMNQKCIRLANCTGEHQTMMVNCVDGDLFSIHPKTSKILNKGKQIGTDWKPCDDGSNRDECLANGLPPFEFHLDGFSYQYFTLRVNLEQETKTSEKLCVIANRTHVSNGSADQCRTEFELDKINPGGRCNFQFSNDTWTFLQESEYEQYTGPEWLGNISVNMSRGVYGLVPIRFTPHGSKPYCIAMGVDDSITMEACGENEYSLIYNSVTKRLKYTAKLQDKIMYAASKDLEWRIEASVDCEHFARWNLEKIRYGNQGKVRIVQELRPYLCVNVRNTGAWGKEKPSITLGYCGSAAHWDLVPSLEEVVPLSVGEICGDLTTQQTIDPQLETQRPNPVSTSDLAQPSESVEWTASTSEREGTIMTKESGSTGGIQSILSAKQQEPTPTSIYKETTSSSIPVETSQTSNLGEATPTNKTLENTTASDQSAFTREPEYATTNVELSISISISEAGKSISTSESSRAIPANELNETSSTRGHQTTSTTIDTSLTSMSEETTEANKYGEAVSSSELGETITPPSTIKSLGSTQAIEPEETNSSSGESESTPTSESEYSTPFVETSSSAQSESTETPKVVDPMAKMTTSEPMKTETTEEPAESTSMIATSRTTKTMESEETLASTEINEATPTMLNRETSLIPKLTGIESTSVSSIATSTKSPTLSSKSQENASTTELKEAENTTDPEETATTSKPGETISTVEAPRLALTSEFSNTTESLELKDTFNTVGHSGSTLPTDTGEPISKSGFQTTSSITGVTEASSATGSKEMRHPSTSGLIETVEQIENSSTNNLSESRRTNELGRATPTSEPKKNASTKITMATISTMKTRETSSTSNKEHTETLAQFLESTGTVKSIFSKPTGTSHTATSMKEPVSPETSSVAEIEKNTSMTIPEASSTAKLERIEKTGDSGLAVSPTGFRTTDTSSAGGSGKTTSRSVRVTTKKTTTAWIPFGDEDGYDDYDDYD